MPFTLGAEANLIAVMLDLGFMPQGCLYLKEGEEKNKRNIFSVAFFANWILLLFCKPFLPTSLSASASLP